jgi:hypothetical protein
MFKVTDDAVALVAEELDRRETPARVVRFCHDTEGLHMRLSNAHPGDKSFAHKGRTVFVVDDDLAQRLDSRTLGVKKTAGGNKLSLRDLSPSAAEA